MATAILTGHTATLPRGAGDPATSTKRRVLEARTLPSARGLI